RLRALGDLDLDLIGLGEVLDVDAEAARCHLADPRAALVAVRVGGGAAAGLAPLAAVRPAAEAVHRDRERLVCLRRERAEAHRAGREALDDLARPLRPAATEPRGGVPP